MVAESIDLALGAASCSPPPRRPRPDPVLVIGVGLTSPSWHDNNPRAR